MSNSGKSVRSRRLPAEPARRVASARPAKRAAGEVLRPNALQTQKPEARNGNGAFDPEAFLARAGLGKKNLHLKKSEAAYAQGDAADAIFYVQKGQLRVTVSSAQGKEATIALVGGGEFLGEDCMVSAHPLRLSTATAMNECALLRISKTEMLRALSRESAFSNVFVSFLLVRNARMQADLVDQLFNSSEKRLARILLLLAQFGKESKPEVVVPKISQEVLAEMIGTTRSRVSFFMNRFRTLGFIEYNGEIRVHNSLLNIFLQE
jgi:CRP/FNR family transcriptional regulator, cyclic AMP receptor protein